MFFSKSSLKYPTITSLTFEVSVEGYDPILGFPPFNPIIKVLGA